MGQAGWRTTMSRDHTAPRASGWHPGCFLSPDRRVRPGLEAPFRMLRFLSLHREDAAAVRRELAAGLLEKPPRVAPKFLYDALGSRLFEAIVELPEYGLARAERAIVEAHLPDIVQAIGPQATLVDLGAGTCEKAARLFAALRPRRYVAVDISVEFLRAALVGLEQRFAAIDFIGVGLDFSAGLSLPQGLVDGPVTVLYPGSSIGNFTPPEALAFLRTVRVACHGGGLLIGVDRLKDAEVLQRAYDDALQVTAAFNRNLLRRLNQLLGTDARVEDFRHVSHFDAAQSRVEMHLEAVRDVTLRWADGACSLRAGERIHTENACKYGPGRFEAILHEAGFRDILHWTDPQESFSVFHARA